MYVCTLLPNSTGSVIKMLLREQNRFPQCLLMPDRHSAQFSFVSHPLAGKIHPASISTLGHLLELGRQQQAPLVTVLAFALVPASLSAYPVEKAPC